MFIYVYIYICIYIYAGKAAAKGAAKGAASRRIVMKARPVKIKKEKNETEAAEDDTAARDEIPTPYSFHLHL